MTYRSSSASAGATATSTAPAVPTGAAINDIALVGIYMELTAAITPPTGFTQKVDLPTSASANGRLAVFWKRLTAADTGTYSFSWTGSSWCLAHCGLWSGRVTSGDPFDVAPGTIEGSSASTTSINPGCTPVDAGVDLVGYCTSFAGGVFTAPSGMTARQNDGNIILATLDNQAAGATGTKTFTNATSSFMKSAVGALAPAGAVTLPPIIVMPPRR